MSKAGLKGIGILVVILLAFVYEAKASTGILLPMLIIADIIAVVYYRRAVRWDYLKRFLPWMIVGVLFGTYVGKEMPEEIFKKGMAIIILISVLIMFALERYDKSKIPDRMWFAGSMGFAAGFTTMIGNLAGAFSNIFFLASRIPKIEFIGTAAWLFFFINLFKLPFHIWSWKTIDLDTLYINLTLVPGIIVGFYIGLKIVDKFKEHQFRKFILVMTAIGAMTMIFR
ncbi:MAG: sulfite exporter TauE/SafE family protein [Saprospiraceae bacterium]|nr:sulfite exporter TauE/SafE family protein [Saprospiraceae bacterium]